jgi:hypothetical protein
MLKENEPALGFWNTEALDTDTAQEGIGVSTFQEDFKGGVLFFPGRTTNVRQFWRKASRTPGKVF